MINSSFNLDEKTIRELGLHQTDKLINAHLPHTARVFEYPELDNVFVMESDLYGNTVPDNTCFLAFNGHHGLIGRYLGIDKLKTASIQEIKKIVECNSEG